MTWYAILSAPSRGPEVERNDVSRPQRTEFIAAHNLREQGFQVFLPYERIRRKRKLRGRDQHEVITVRVPLFGRYMFVNVEDGQSLFTVHSTPFISTVIYLGQNPLVVPDGVIAEMRARVSWLPRVKDETKRIPFKSGDVVEFVDGNPFAGFCATVRVDAGNRVRVWCDELSKVSQRDISVPPGALKLRNVAGGSASE